MNRKTFLATLLGPLAFFRRKQNRNVIPVLHIRDNDSWVLNNEIHWFSHPTLCFEEFHFQKGSSIITDKETIGKLIRNGGEQPINA